MPQSGPKIFSEGDPPPVPADLDLRDFEYLPLKVVRLLRSELIITGSDFEAKFGLMSWCLAWHEVPTGSLPNKNDVLADYFGFGRGSRNVQKWMRAREKGALRDWVLCSDGRLYHPVVCEVALETSAKRKRGANAGRISAEVKKQNQELTGTAVEQPVDTPRSNTPLQQPAKVSSNSLFNNDGREGIDGRDGGKRARETDTRKYSLADLKSIWPAARWTHEVDLSQLWTFQVEGRSISAQVFDGALRYLRSVGKGPDNEPHRFCSKAIDWIRAERWTETPPAHATPMPLQLPRPAPGDAVARMRPKRVKDCARYPSDRWLAEWGEPPPVAEVLLWRRRWCEHLVAFADGKAPWDGATWGNRMPVESDAAGARAFLASTDAGGNPVAQNAPPSASASPGAKISLVPGASVVSETKSPQQRKNSPADGIGSARPLSKVSP